MTQKYNKDELVKLLEEEVLKVTFEKANGEIREMTCTLMPSIRPLPTKSDPMSQKKVREISDEVIPVWDIFKNSWRSFRIDSIVKIEVS